MGTAVAVVVGEIGAVARAFDRVEEDAEATPLAFDEHRFVFEDSPDNGGVGHAVRTVAIDADVPRVRHRHGFVLIFGEDRIDFEAGDRELAAGTFELLTCCWGTCSRSTQQRCSGGPTTARTEVTLASNRRSLLRRRAS